MNDWLAARIRSSSGSVLMEYVVINLAIAMPILFFWHTSVFNPSENRWVGRFGKGIQSAFQKVSSGVGLPIP